MYDGAEAERRGRGVEGDEASSARVEGDERGVGRTGGLDLIQKGVGVGEKERYRSLPEWCRGDGGPEYGGQVEGGGAVQGGEASLKLLSRSVVTVTPDQCVVDGVMGRLERRVSRWLAEGEGARRGDRYLPSLGEAVPGELCIGPAHEEPRPTHRLRLSVDCEVRGVARIRLAGAQGGCGGVRGGLGRCVLIFIILGRGPPIQ